jgi:photosystem II stability/assembly factor-like uncharacterized protein
LALSQLAAAQEEEPGLRAVPVIPGATLPPGVGAGQPPEKVVGPDGRRWVEVGHGLRWGIKATHIDASADDPQLIYVGTEVGYVFRSLDGGVTWDELRLLPDDVPLVDVSMINLSVLWVPNNGLVDDYVAPIPEGAYRRPGSRGRRRPGVWQEDMLSLAPYFSGMQTFYFTSAEEDFTRTYALGGATARVEVEDPGNLMASFFRGVSAQPGKVNWIDICPTNTSVAFAGTNFGAFRTRDKGLTWDRVYIGSDIWENQVTNVHCHPEDDNMIFIVTQSGLRYSEDGGDKWRRPASNLGIWPGYFVTTHPLDRNTLLVGTNLGGYTTTIGSDTQETIFLQDTPHPLVRNVTMIRGTTDPNIYYATTRDGGCYSHDGGETWERMGEFLIGRYYTWMVHVDPRDPLHAYIMTDWHVYETRDGGVTLIELLPSWNELFASFIDPRDPDRLWLMGMSQVWVYEHPRQVPARPSATSRRAAGAMRVDPGYQAVLDRIMERAGIDDASVAGHMRRIRYSALFPTLNFVGWGYYGRGSLEVGGPGVPNRYTHYWASAPCSRRFAGGNEINFCRYRSARFEFLLGSPYRQYNFGAFVVLSWPLGRALMDERLTGRMWIDIFRMRERIMYNIVDYWADRRRLLEYLAAGTATPAEEQAYLLRLAEMSAVLDALSDGFIGGPFGDEPWEGL